ncbi:MAG: serine hydrolase [Aequorivita sp.]|nr:serine hydrolase [Aequorivita sp.]MAO48244.1 serine hydrolase [Aequorivita sp.]MBF29827.1 serine hydrolase [Aequorivita sp.]|tara:strand:- start:676 stop:2241 length:1566 start_codon:yes stop_codon:yes gene_type:complete
MKTISLKALSFILVFSFLNLSVQAQVLSSSQIDSLVQKTMKTFDVPGMAVAVLKDGKVYHKNTYGVRSLKTNEPVDENTLFGVASNTKAFTTAALAQLIDQGKLGWDTKVTDIIPEFKLYDPYVTAEFTVRDLVTHRSGLGLGAGDLMIFPANNTTTKAEMIHNLRYLKPVSSFRSQFDYDNLLYIVAGEIVARVSGKSYDDYIADNFFKPLGMDRSLLSIPAITADNNRIDGHAPVNGKLEITGNTFTQLATPAGGIYASINDMATWVQAQLNKGKYGEKLQDSLFSKKMHREMWTPQTLLRSRGPYNTHFSAYGLGWFLSDVNGYFQVIHTGGLLGIVSQVTLIPELELGIIVLTNQQSGAAFNAITNSIKDGYFNIQGEDRIQQYNERRLAGERAEDSITAKVEADIEKQLKSKDAKPKPETVTGTYKDPWFGKVTINEQNGKLRFKAEKSLDLIGTLTFYKGTTYVVRWDDASLKADAFVNFGLNTEGNAKGFTMSAISPLTDFSYDYQDLDFVRVE